MDVGEVSLKLILSVDALTPPLSGIGRYTWELTNRLAARPEIARLRYFRNGHWVDDPASLLATAAGFRPKRQRNYPNWVTRMYWEHTCRGNVFHSPNYFLPPYADKGVVTVHDLSVFKFPETHPVERVKQFEGLFRQTLDVARYLITDSEVTRREVIEFFSWPADRITAVHLGVSPTFMPRPVNELTEPLQRYGLNPGQYVLCVSTIEPRKRIDSLIEAYSRLSNQIRARYPLVLVGGKGWQSDHLHALIATGQREGWLRYLGFVDEADLPLVYSGAYVFVYPSIYEGFGLPVAEALASGVPVITSNRSTLPEVSAGAAMLIDPDDIEHFSEALKAAIFDLSWREQAIKIGLAVASVYNWDTCIEKTVQVYSKL